MFEFRPAWPLILYRLLPSEALQRHRQVRSSDVELRLWSNSDSAKRIFLLPFVMLSVPASKYPYTYRPTSTAVNSSWSFLHHRNTEGYANTNIVHQHQGVALERNIRSWLLAPASLSRKQTPLGLIGSLLRMILTATVRHSFQVPHSALVLPVPCTLCNGTSHVKILRLIKLSPSSNWSRGIRRNPSPTERDLPMLAYLKDYSPGMRQLGCDDW